MRETVAQGDSRKSHFFFSAFLYLRTLGVEVETGNLVEGSQELLVVPWGRSFSANRKHYGPRAVNGDNGLYGGLIGLFSHVWSQMSLRPGPVDSPHAGSLHRGIRQRNHEWVALLTF